MGEGITQIQIEVLPHPYLSQRGGHDASRGWGGERVQILKHSGRFCLFTHTHIHFYLTFTKSMQNLHMLGWYEAHILSWVSIYNKLHQRHHILSWCLMEYRYFFLLPQAARALIWGWVKSNRPAATAKVVLARGSPAWDSRPDCTTYPHGTAYHRTQTTRNQTFILLEFKA
jgi:hypothetical protein